ncbi:OsmC family protein [Flavobacterium sp. MFBS3-15]|uniref:OsmC family protein n=1 Tax=Flavobacterium sp. MFBS3-15 TaxID=2989816 RepID=UPI0022369B67|nr:OsmC family protein [Flavobacterium sp. MFBS3-15]MCW4470047.1 OsmC family protein [Flavobacterium sp. MFBS3-15]
MKMHHYSTTVNWTGNTGKGTQNYTGYTRDHAITVDGKPVIPGSSDPAFRGDPSRYNPEELLLASLSSCHMLWYLHLCAEAGIIVTQYADTATGVMEETANGSGKFTCATLNPRVTVQHTGMIEKAIELHKKANTMCFIANSCNFPVLHNPTCTAGT